METLIEALVNVLQGNEYVMYVLTGIGSLVTIVSVIDATIPDHIDGGFYKKLQNMFIVGVVLKVLSRFSLLRSKKDG